MTTYVAYCRVSTERQGRSGLGLEAQQAAIAAFLRADDALLQPPYVEVESGRRADRPKLAAAIERCRKTGATLLIAKLDRLARNVAFVAGLQESGVAFRACDFPDANRLMVHILVAVAEHEAEATSRRTKDALARKKAWYRARTAGELDALRLAGKATELGGDRGYRPPAPPTAAETAEATRKRQERADHAAFAVLPVIERLRGEGVTSLGGLAKRLAELGVPTPRGKDDEGRAKGAWTATAVKRVLARVA